MMCGVYDSVSFVDHTITVETAVVRYSDIPPIHLLVFVHINISASVAKVKRSKYSTLLVKMLKLTEGTHSRRLYESFQ